MNEAAETTVPRARPLALSASPDTLFRVGVGALTAVVAAFLFARLTVWPPHEDETLALFAEPRVGRPADPDGARRARRRAAPLPLRVGDHAHGRRARGAAARLDALRRRERAADRAARRAAHRPRRRARRDGDRRAELDAALPRHLRPDVLDLPLHGDAVVHRAAAGARAARPARLAPLGARDARLHRDASVRRARARVAGALRPLLAAAARGVRAVRRGLRARDPVLAQRHRAREPLRRRRRRRRDEARQPVRDPQVPRAGRRRLHRRLARGARRRAAARARGVRAARRARGGAAPSSSPACS